MAKAKKGPRQQAALGVESAQPQAPVEGQAQGMEEQCLGRHRGRDPGGVDHRRAGHAVQERLVVVVKNHYVVVQVPVYLWAEPPCYFTHGPEADLDTKSGGLVLDVVLASLADVAVRARAAADSVVAAESGKLLAKEPIPDIAGKEPAMVRGIEVFDASELDEGTGDAGQHKAGEQQLDDGGIGTFIARLAPYVVAMVCLPDIWARRALGMDVAAVWHPGRRVLEES